MARCAKHATAWRKRAIVVASLRRASIEVRKKSPGRLAPRLFSIDAGAEIGVKSWLENRMVEPFWRVFSSELPSKLPS